jgi:23S rRNA (uracil-5-)-methyltransferase RumA
MHKRGSFYDIVTVDDCGIIDEDMRQILRHTLLYFSEAQTDFYHKLRHAGYLRNLLVRKASGTGEILIDLITSSDVTSVPQEDVLLENWVKIMCSLPMEGTLVGILHTRNDRPAEVVENQGTQILFGQNYFYETLLGLRFRITPFSFFQTNSAGAEVLYRTVREFITDGDAGVLQGKTIYDLYSGTGTIAQVLSPIAGQVIGVEIIAEAVVAAKENAVENHLDNCRFLTGDVLKILDELRDKPDYIILDPPREGIHPRALEKIIAYGVDRIVYISCKPTSLARDLAVFLAHGYSVTRLCCVDMFPGTVHVETVVLLSKGEIDSKKIRVEFSLEDLDTSGLQRGATYGQIKERVLEQTGLKVSSLYIAQVKQKCGIIERENYNKPKSEDARQPQCPLEKEAAIMDALKHFVMI